MLIRSLLCTASLFLAACQINSGSYQERVVTGVAIGAVAGALTGDDQNIVRGAVAGGLTAALTYGQQPHVGQGDCRRQYAGNPRAIQACQDGVRQGLERRARQYGGQPGVHPQDCYRRFSGAAAQQCATAATQRLQREQRALVRDARRTGQRLGYGM